MKHADRMSMVAAAVLFVSPAVFAGGLLDDLKKAVKLPAQQSQQNAPQGGANTQPSGSGSPSTGGATSVNTDFPNCMAQSNGSHEKLLSQVLQRKLTSGATLAPQERQRIQEDIEYLNAAATNPRAPAPDPKNPQRYFLEMTDAEQMEASNANNQYLNKVRETCEAAYGGMSQFSDPSGRRQPVGNTTEPFPQLSATAPVDTSAAEARAEWNKRMAEQGQSSQSQELAAMHEKRRAERNNPQPVNAAAANASAQAWLAAHPFTPRSYTAGSATQADYLEKSGTLACYDRQKGFRAHQTAERLMTKRATVAPQDRQELDAWVTAWQAAEQAGKDEPAPISPNNQQGWLKFLTNADQQELNMASSIVHNQIAGECASMDHMEIGSKNSKVKQGN